jgi:LmbE family N-acetylglucosaminyl deacetylase
VHDKVISNDMFHARAVPDSSELLTLMGERSDVKADEVRTACRLLGVEDVFFFGADDAVLLVTEENVRRLARVLRELRPDIVLTHFPKESDGLTAPHAVAGQIVLHAIRLAAGVDPGDRNPPHRTSQVFFFGQGAASIRRDLWEAKGDYYCDVFIDITDVIGRKLAAMDCLVSQGYAGAYARKRLEAGDGAWGRAANCAYAEGFISQSPEVHYYLPVTEHALKMAHLSDHEIMAVYSCRFPLD